jgi:hypothetical protein
LNRFIVEVELFEELVKPFVAPVVHLLQVDGGQVVHGERSDEAHLDAERPVDTRAVHADENAIIHRDPLRVLFA